MIELMAVFSLVLGVLIVALSLFLIRKELLGAQREQKRSFNSLSDDNVAQVMQYLKKLEKEVDDLNASYYEIVSDLEGKYSVHEKEIEILQEKLEALEATGAPSRRNGVRLSEPKPAQKSEPRPSEPMDEQEKICLEAVKLKHQGLSIGQIARELNMGIGELQLILKTKR